MITQILLTAGLTLLLVYALHNARGAIRWLAYLFAIGSATGIALVWNPDLSTRIAHVLGIGRGVDLIFYFALLFLLFGFFLLNLKLVAMRRQITELVRQHALANPIPPETSHDLSS